MRVTGTEIDIWFRPLGREIERRHDYWQKRLLPLLAADQIREFAGANRLLDQLLPHVNQHEIHREPGTTPHAARQQALLEKPSVLRPIPACPCWPFVWSQQTRVRIGDDGTVPIATHRQSIDATPRAPSSAAYAQMATSITFATPQTQ